MQQLSPTPNQKRPRLDSQRRLVNPNIMNSKEAVRGLELDRENVLEHRIGPAYVSRRTIDHRPNPTMQPMDRIHGSVPRKRAEGCKSVSYQGVVYIGLHPETLLCAH
jgi:hypothetical protein